MPGPKPTPPGRPTELRAIRLHLGETQAGFAARLGVSARTMRRWEAGHVPLDDRTMRAARALRRRKLTS